MTVIETYSLQIIRDDGPMRELGPIAWTLKEFEENLTLLLPDGYRAKIMRWDEEEPDA